MSSNFGASMAQTYIGATLGNMVSQVTMRGIRGGEGPVNWTDTALNGLQVGTAFIAYPVACRILSNVCPRFKENMTNPNGNKLMVYTLGGAGAAAILTVVNLPLSRMAISLKTKACHHPKPRDFVKTFFDNVGSSIGFAATMGTIAPHVPIPKDSLGQWARTHLLVNVSNIGGKVFAYPIHHLRHGSTLSGMVGGYIQNMGGVVITGDATNHFKNVLQFLLE